MSSNLERVLYYLELAKKSLKESPELSKRYVQIARAIAMHKRIKIKKLKFRFCKGCGAYLVPGYNAKVQIDKNKKIIKYICLYCKSERRLRYK
jgi:ribonuclease P protein subunit RPR2